VSALRYGGAPRAAGNGNAVRFWKDDPDEVRAFTRIRRAPRGCWEWIGYVDGSGYGRFRGRHRQWESAHRWFFEFLVGPVPDGMELDHLCRNRRCVNPRHLEPVTHRVNVLRGVSVPAVNATKSACPAGHRYTATNTYTYRGMRYCKACRHARLREGRRAQREGGHRP
jgi:hypothetical protein